MNTHDNTNPAADDAGRPRYAIDAQNVQLTYSDGTRAVNGVDIQIPEGEFFGFLGPNGAG
ncbi:daunorubicin ABC transporter ATP-binding protein, partial [Haloarcula sp. Atlit-7R]